MIVPLLLGGLLEMIGLDLTTGLMLLLLGAQVLRMGRRGQQVGKRVVGIGEYAAVVLLAFGAAASAGWIDVYPDRIIAFVSGTAWDLVKRGLRAGVDLVPGVGA